MHRSPSTADHRARGRRRGVRVNDLEADIVCHVGDIADGAVEVRRDQFAR